MCFVSSFQISIQEKKEDEEGSTKYTQTNVNDDVLFGYDLLSTHVYKGLNKKKRENEI